MTFAKQLLWVTVIVLVFVGSVACSSQKTVFFDIPETSARRALDAFASQSSTEIIYSVDEMNLIRTNRVYGRFTREEALKILLDGTSLRFGSDNKSGAIAVWNKNFKS